MSEDDEKRRDHDVGPEVSSARAASLPSRDPVVRDTEALTMLIGLVLHAAIERIERDPALAARIRTALAPEDVRAPTPPKLLRAREAARALSVSVATLNRAARQGCPHVVVGTGNRFDLAEVRAWFHGRGRAPVEKAAPDPDRIDVASVARRAGFRAA